MRRAESSVAAGSGRWWAAQGVFLASLMLFFALGRAFFVAWNVTSFSDVAVGQILASFYHGLRLDLSMAGYAWAYFFVAQVFLFSGRFFRYIFKALIITLFVLFALAFFADAEMYSYWGCKIDVSCLDYLRTPDVVAASADVGHVALLIILVVVVGVAAAAIMNRWLLPPLLTIRGWRSLSALLVLPLAFAFSRGSIGVSGVNASTAYFSTTQQANHAAVNAAWSFLNSVFDDNEKFTAQWDDSLARFIPVFEPVFDSAAPSVLKVERPNVIMVILESFTANAVGYRYNNHPVVPNLERILGDNYYFPNCYATGNRSSRGIAALLSGYPAYPSGSVMSYPRKYAALGKLAGSLAKAGYATAFYHGGNTDFANMGAFAVANGFGKLFDLSRFPASQVTTKWGVHDDRMMARFWRDLRRESRPFFYTAFTLSSHEPFDVPYKSPLADDTPRGEFLNSMSFTDSVLGCFYDSLRSSSLWDSVLLVLVADHGHSLPLGTRPEAPASYRIPLVFAGGALRPEYRGAVDSRLVSQCDIPRTLLRQLGMDDTRMTHSRDFLTSNDLPAMYIFNFGYGALSSAGDTVVVDARSGRRLKYGAAANPQWDSTAAAWFQYYLKDFY